MWRKNCERKTIEEQGEKQTKTIEEQKEKQIKQLKQSRKTDQIKNRNTEQKSIDFLFSKDSLIEESTFELNKIVEL